MLMTFTRHSLSVVVYWQEQNLNAVLALCPLTFQQLFQWFLKQLFIKRDSFEKLYLVSVNVYLVFTIIATSKKRFCVFMV